MSDNNLEDCHWYWIKLTRHGDNWQPAEYHTEYTQSTGYFNLFGVISEWSLDEIHEVGKEIKHEDT